MVLLTSSVLNPLILVLILSASGQNWCFWLFTVGLLFLFFFFPVKLFFPDTHIWITSSEPSLLASSPAPTPHALHICMHQGLVPDYRMSSPWVIQLSPFGTINNYVCTSPNCLLSQIFSGSHTYTKLIINESMMFFLLFYHLILTTMLRSHLIIYSLFSFYE